MKHVLKCFNTQKVSRNFLVWKSCGKAQFQLSFRRIANFANFTGKYLRWSLCLKKSYFEGHLQNGCLTLWNHFVSAKFQIKNSLFRPATFVKFLRIFFSQHTSRGCFYRLLEHINNHCVKSVHILSYSGPYFPAFGLNVDQNNSE